MKKKIQITFSQEPNFDEWAFKYFLLALNPKLETIEFQFVESKNGQYIFNDNEIAFNDAKEIYFSHKNFFNEDDRDKPDYVITIISSSFDNNFFSFTDGHFGMITTDVWDSYFSPPSVFEYLVNSIMSMLIHMISGNKLKSFKSVKGCILDFNYQKKNKKNCILTGFISDRVKVSITNLQNKAFLKDIQYILNREWLGSLEERGTIAWNLKHSFNTDIFKDSGFNKTFKEKIFQESHKWPFQLFLLVIAALMGAYARSLFS